MNTSTTAGFNYESDLLEDIPSGQVKNSTDERILFLEEIILQLTERQLKANESLLREKELNKTISHIISLASHEFRSPLTNIQFSAALLERYYERLDKDKIFAHLNKIQLAVGDMNGTINDFLSLERIGSGHLSPMLNEFDLTSLASEITGDMQLMLQENQQISYRNKGSNTHCRLDFNLLKHCIVNLISNAIKYSGKNGLINFETEIRGNKCVIEIGDNGMGIPKEDLPHVFDAFFRASNAYGIPGTGLGLHIVERSVKQMNGLIQVRSNLQTGTRFSLIIPI
jgi:signal transduction histidine kinase